MFQLTPYLLINPKSVSNYDLSSEFQPIFLMTSRHIQLHYPNSIFEGSLIPLKNLMKETHLPNAQILNILPITSGIS